MRFNSSAARFDDRSVELRPAAGEIGVFDAQKDACAQLIRPIPHHVRSKNVPQMEQAIGRRRKTGERASHGVLYAG